MPTTERTISQVLDEFLIDQRKRLSPKTYSKYDSIIDLFKSYLESYWPSHGQVIRFHCRTDRDALRFHRCHAVRRVHPPCH